MSTSDVSFELLHKYNVQGPRYTSYPPAPSWRSDIGPVDYEKAIAAGNAALHPTPLSLYFHLPFCEKLCYFCGCTTVITGRNRSQEDPYITAILREIDWLGKRVDPARPVVQLHLGGGTPTYLTPENLKRLMERVALYFRFSPDAEIGVEVDPRVTTEKHLEALRARGFNRVSMGVQDFDPAVQKAINRIQPYEDTRNLVQAARAQGYESVNMDLIYGLPHQTVASFERTIDQILEIAPDRLAVYSYAHVPWMKKHQDILEPHLPGEREKFDIFRAAMRRFTAAGFEYIGMDHFARPGDELANARGERTLWRNFQGYTTKAGTDLFGLGMSAIGNVHGAYFQNKKELKEYQEAVAHGAATQRGFTLSQDDKVRARVIQNLLCHAEVVKPEIEKEFGIRFDNYFAAALERLKTAQADGLVDLLPEAVRPTKTGRVFFKELGDGF